LKCCRLQNTDNAQTKGYSLEEMGAQFGDDVVDMDGHRDITAESEKEANSTDETQIERIEAV
jgi:hypothetical protein